MTNLNITNTYFLSFKSAVNNTDSSCTVLTLNTTFQFNPSSIKSEKKKGKLLIYNNNNNKKICLDNSSQYHKRLVCKVNSTKWSDSRWVSTTYCLLMTNLHLHLQSQITFYQELVVRTCWPSEQHLFANMNTNITLKCEHLQCNNNLPH